MKYIDRTLGEKLIEAAEGFPALILTGPRRAGKTTLLRHCFPHAEYVLLEALDVIDRARSDPRGFLNDHSRPLILDEIQNVPELFNYIRALIDEHPDETGQWLLTGSQEAQLMRGVTESMAGRAALFHLLPFSREEDASVSLLHGGFPEVLRKPALADTWFRSYLQTYLERDVRAVSSIRNLSIFRRFIALVASRSGQVLNKTDLAAPLGVSVPTLTEWLSILEITGQILLIPPFYENFGKRLIKSPKLYMVDSGLACHLLGIDDAETLKRSPFRGAIFEGAVAAEILKSRWHRGRDGRLYTLRDQQGLEVDFLIDEGNRKLTLLEAKATETPSPDMAKPIQRLRKSVRNYTCSAWVVHAAGGKQAEPASLAPEVRSIGFSALHRLWKPGEGT